MKKPLEPLEKAKRIYCGELLVFALVFLVLGSLFITGVISPAGWKQWTFTIVTLLGGTWLVVDFVWCLASKKRRAKNCLLDKAMVAPMGIAVFVFDIVALCSGWLDTEVGVTAYRYGIGIPLLYYACAYIFQGVYHYFHPIPAMYEIAAEEEKERKEAAEKAVAAPAEIPEPKEEKQEETKPEE